MKTTQPIILNCMDIQLQLILLLKIELSYSEYEYLTINEVNYIRKIEKGEK